MIKAKIYVILKPSVLDPQGNAAVKTLHSLGYQNVTELRINKYIEVGFDETDKESVIKQLKQMCDKLLVNANTEVYRYEIIDDFDKPSK